MPFVLFSDGFCRHADRRRALRRLQPAYDRLLQLCCANCKKGLHSQIFSCGVRPRLDAQERLLLLQWALLDRLGGCWRSQPNTKKPPDICDDDGDDRRFAGAHTSEGWWSRSWHSVCSAPHDRALDRWPWPTRWRAASWSMHVAQCVCEHECCVTAHSGAEDSPSVHWEHMMPGL